MNTDTNNEVARLRAEVQRAIEDRNRIGIKIRGEYLPKLKKSKNEVARLREENQRLRARLIYVQGCDCDNYLHPNCDKLNQ